MAIEFPFDTSVSINATEVPEQIKEGAMLRGRFTPHNATFVAHISQNKFDKDALVVVDGDLEPVRLRDYEVLQPAWEKDAYYTSIDAEFYPLNQNIKVVGFGMPSGIFDDDLEDVIAWSSNYVNGEWKNEVVLLRRSDLKYFEKVQ